MPRLFVDNLTVIDCSVLDPDRGLIGASWMVDVELSGELDQQSMVFDFAKVKKTIKHIIDESIDHKLVVPNLFAGVTITHGDGLYIQFTDHQGNTINHRSPEEAVCQIASSRINRTAISGYLSNIILDALPDNVQQLQLTLREESVTGHYYSYSHGLKKHDGNCQRIAHGHRSLIQIWQNGQRDPQLERTIAERWHDIYLGTSEDIVTQNAERIEFAYTTSQGKFFIELPKHRVHLMQCDSTVECIAEHLLELLAKPSSDLKIRAFEGIGKGAIAITG